MRRRTFFQASLAPFVLTAAETDKAKRVRASDVEAKIQRRDYAGITKEDLPTPALVVDRAVLESNLRKMAEHCKTTGMNIRSHCKIHKSVDLAKRQMALGSLGICCATIAETELMVGAGIKNVLHTCQPAGRNKIGRAVDLAKREPSLMLVADDPETVDLLNEAAGALGIKTLVLADIYAGLTRHGHVPGEAGLALAQKIDKSKHLRFGGIMGYSGGASHTKGWEARQEKSRKDVGPVVETAMLCKKAGLDTRIITGGSTGTYNIDQAIGLTELQAGSYVFMDSLYNRIGGKSSGAVYSDFGTSLHMLTTVISRNHAGQVTIDAGNKALLKPTDEVKGRPEVVVENQGAEFGILKWKEGNGFKLGEKAELVTSNLDMTTNCYDRYYICEGERLVDVWPIMGRSGPAQR